MSESRYKFTKKMIFMNKLKGEPDSIELIWNVDRGFSSKEELTAVIENEGFNPEVFGVLTFMNGYYGICISTKNRIVVITSTSIYYKEGRFFKKYPLGSLSNPVYEIPKGKVITDRNDEFIRDFSEFDKYYTTICGNKIEYKYNFEHNAISMLAMVSFDVKIPLSKLDSMILYKPDIPPYKTLLSHGISSINPFSGESCYLDGVTCMYNPDRTICMNT